MDVIPLPYKILAAVLSVTAVYTVGYLHGKSVTNTAWELKAAKQQQIAAELYQQKSESYNAVAKAFENEKLKSKVVYETITKHVEKIVTRPVYRNVCIDDDGLRDINAALAGKSPDTR